MIDLERVFVNAPERVLNIDWAVQTFTIAYAILDKRTLSKCNPVTP